MGRRHLEAYLKKPEVIVSACSDSNPEALKFLETRRLGCKRFADWHQMLKDESFDVLSVVTNGPSHAEITIAAARAGVPRIICEKPMATSINAALQMAEAAKTSRARLAINYSRRWAQGYRRLKESLKQDTIGELCEVRCVCGGGLLACNGSHFFDLMRFLSDSEPVSLVGFVDKRGTPNPRGAQFTDPGAFGIVRFRNGMRGFVDMFEDLGIPPTIEIVGSIGRVTIDEIRNKWTMESREEKDRSEPLGKYDLPLKQHPIPSEPLDPQMLVGKTIDEILGDGQISSTADDGLAALQMVMGFHASDHQGNVQLTLPLAAEYNDMVINFT